MPEQVVHPGHYAQYPIEPVTFIMRNGLPYGEGNVVKYILRHAQKNGKQDVLKALRYAQMVLQIEYGAFVPIQWDQEQADTEFNVLRNDPQVGQHSGTQPTLATDCRAAEWQKPWDTVPALCAVCGAVEDSYCGARYGGNE